MSHGHFLVNGRKVDVPSYLVRNGDKIEISEKSKKSEMFKTMDLDEEMKDRNVPEWLKSDRKNGSGDVISKPETDDMRESPCLDIIPKLQENNLQISVYDPVAMDEAKKLLQNVQFTDSIEDCINNSDALVILTEWNEFRSLSPERLKKQMKGNILIDLRNALNPDNFRESGFSPTKTRVK